MDFQTALKELGVSENSLTEEEKRSLDERGFVILKEIVDAAWLGRLRERYEALLKQEGASAGKEVHQEAGTRRLADLVNKGDVFDRIYTQPKVLAAVAHIIKRPFKLSSLNARDAEPGQGHQSLHADWGPRKADEPFHVANSVWMVDDFTAENGATRAVPGSQLWEGSAGDGGKDASAPYPGEALAIAPAGSVLVFNAHVWHGGTLNRTKTTRRACHGYFCAREHGQQLDQREYLRKNTWDRLSPAAKTILDVA